MVRLSVMDAHWPIELVNMASELEVLGYSRIWTTEHHGPHQSSSPTVLAAVIAARTRAIRIGTAGVLMRLYNPYKVAEDFRLLTLLFPGRIDLGVASAISMSPEVATILVKELARTQEDYEARIADLARYALGASDPREVMQGRQAGPMTTSLPELWICGASLESAALAARMGARYAHHEYLARMKDPQVDGRRILDEYRRAFTPSPTLAAPWTALACHGLCTDPADDAHRSWSVSSPRLSASYVGGPAECGEQLLGMRNHHEVDELVVQSITGDPAQRIESYRLLARALELPPRTPG